jgi:murein L,D-transpeptidase YafK
MANEHAPIRLIIEKRRRRLSVVAGDRPVQSYPIVLGRNAAADKRVEGDEATPLGEFYICARNPRSRFFLSLCISYPATAHADRGLAAGVIDPVEHAAILAAQAARRMPPQKTGLGGEIYIHGRDAAHEPAAGGEARDWTRGCIALDNPAMAEIYALAALGTPVTILD